MLDTETKKNIDDARNILVGKLPNPISQVEQITIALIYKFMSDMDREAVEVFNGKPKFFTGIHKKYDWQKLFDPNLGGHDILKLYAEGIEAMNTNPNIPALFREVFKNAYLPYRDPETLKMFLKTINKFSYDHSERLGDAYEYLLSVLGMQGDAGQFRTQRHIIDFIVKCIEPTKHDTICDPACGTAGFVISSYKYIRNANTDEKGKLKLTPDERKRLANSLYGYDIDPTMVRFALVNMYLHGFISPHIYEYDTLSSEDRWNERYDIILANPPFMTPKGGIRPHKRFSIQASKSEVLFTDYIHEHILPNGRGGVIVPNGIIATTQTAYKQLREMLVKESLIAVVSLPAGVFNPYSGVKTSILLLDKKLSKQTNKILFVKVENDGFDLGAQRREIDRNDLPNATALILAFKQMLRKEITENKLTKLMEKIKLGALVEKEIILANKDVVLSAERYVESNYNGNHDYEIVTIGDVCNINPESEEPKKRFGKNEFVYIDIESVENGTGKVSFSKRVLPNEAPSRARRVVNNGDVIVSTVRPNLKAFSYLENLPERCLASTGFAVLRPTERIEGKYLYRLVLHDYVVKEMMKRSGKGQYPSITQSDIAEIQIPLPPLEVQQAIVAEIESYQKIIDGARQVVENYIPYISINSRWERKRIGVVCTLMTGGTPKSTENKYYGGDIKWLVSGDINKGEIFDCKGRITKLGMESSNTKILPVNSVLIALNGQGKTRATVAMLRTEATCNQSLVSINPTNKNDLLPEFLYYQLKSMYRQIRNLTGDNERSGLSMAIMRDIEIGIAPIELQKELVNQFKKEANIVEANKTLIEMFEGKIKSKIAEVWGE